MACPDWRIALVLGGHPKVDFACEAALLAAVEQEPRAIGQPFSVWTCLDLARHLISHGFPAVSAETIRRHLHWLDYRVIRPVLSINSPDPAYSLKAEQLKQYQQEARRGTIILLYEDEIDLNLLPGIIGCWTRRGHQRLVLTPGQNVKRYGFGAVNFQTGRVTYRLGERKNSDGFCALLEQVVQEYCADDRDPSRPVVIVVDNFVIHHSRKTQSVLAKYADRLSVFALPTYSPKLNIVELLWKYLRRKVTHNHLFRSIGDLAQAVEAFLAALNSQPELVLSVTGCSE